MHVAAAPAILLLFVLVVLYSAPPLNAETTAAAGGKNPFTPKAYLLRYWNKQVSNNLPKPSFLLDKASPLTAADYAAFSKVADDQNSLSTHLPDLCSKANLLCFPDLTASLEKHSHDVSFATYLNENFTNYGTDRDGGVDSFSKYSENDNVIVDTFRRYSRGSNTHDDKFTAYATGSNVIDQRFKTYGTSANGGKGIFQSYNTPVNEPGLDFTSYSDSSNGRKQTFAEYSSPANVGSESFTGYGKNANGAVHDFKTYAFNFSNLIASDFTNYGESGNGPKDTFATYGGYGNVPENTFRSYGTGANEPNESFKNYRNQSTSGDDSFQSYGKKANAGKVDFVNYGKSFFGESDKFSGYGQDAANPVAFDFKIYGVNSTFKDYQKEGTKFSTYNDTPPLVNSEGKRVIRPWVVEPGKFFREEMMRRGTIMPMPDIRDKMPERSFLPRVIVSKFPFSTSKLVEMKRLFDARDDPRVVKMMTDSLSDCERAPSPGEVKRCVASIEDMIDYATSVLGRNVAVRSTDNVRGSKGNIMIGDVKGVDGGKVTMSVSCHQSLYPYMIYYCHSVPKVRVYEADILDPTSKARINHGVAICHLDTSSWSPGHGAFVSLGSGPGKIEVCHWIFENDMTWTIAD